MPKSRTAFWAAKFQGTIERDKAAENALPGMGWQVTVVWECELDDEEKLATKLAAAIQGANRASRVKRIETDRATKLVDRPRIPLHRKSGEEEQRRER